MVKPNKPLGDYRLDGRNPLGYMGVKPYTPPQMVTSKRAPTPNDYQGYTLGTQWIHQKNTTSQSIQYFLASVSEGVAVWVALNNGTPVPGVAIGDINIIYLTTPGAGTYTPSPGMIKCTVECVGGGGGSIGYGSTNSSFVFSPGSAGGSYCKKSYTSTMIGASQSYTVGISGAGGADPGQTNPTTINLGSNGGDTSFGTGPSLITAGGGQAAPITTTNIGIIPSGGIATGGDININGNNGGVSSATATGGGTPVIAGAGGSSPMGFGFGGGSSPNYQATLGPTTHYFDAIGYGGGGSGTFISTGSTRGANGGQGIIIITEYIAAT